jgi:hypothetical protein
MTDWFGYVLLATGLALLILALSQGNRRFWFDSTRLSRLCSLPAGCCSPS